MSLSSIRDLCTLGVMVGLVVGTGCASAGISGVLKQDVVWRADASPVVVIDDVIVPQGVTLTIEPGTRVEFHSGAKLTINGRLLAEGTADRKVVLDRPRGSTGSWSGLRFIGSRKDNRLVHVDMDHASASRRALRVEDSRLLLENVRFSNIDTEVIRLDSPFITIRNCEFPDVGEHQVITGRVLRPGDQLIIEGSTFAATRGGDVVEFGKAQRPGPIVQILRNTFLGGQDDALDLEGGDYHVEGNCFTNYHDGPNTSGTANAVSLTDGTRATLVDNIFYDNDNAILVKNGAMVQLINNTVVASSGAAVQFEEPGRGEERGRGAYIDGSIFWNNGAMFAHLEPQTELVVHRSIVPTAHLDRGEGNLDLDPLFVDEAGDFRLRPGSPAIAAGPDGGNIGAHVQRVTPSRRGSVACP